MATEDLQADSMGNCRTGTQAVRVYTLDGIKDGTVRFNGDGPATVRTLDGTVSVRVPRLVALRKLEGGDVIYTC